MSRITHDNSTLDSRQDNGRSSTDVPLSYEVHSHEVRVSEEGVVLEPRFRNEREEHMLRELWC